MISLLVGMHGDCICMLSSNDRAIDCICRSVGWLAPILQGSGMKILYQDDVQDRAVQERDHLLSHLAQLLCGVVLFCTVFQAQEQEGIK